MLHDELRETLLSKADLFPDILGQETAKEHIKSALLSGRHIIIAGPPGVGKTTLAKNIAHILPAKKASECGYLQGKEKDDRLLPGDERFVRVQGSPDLTAEDLIGDIDPVKALTFGPSSVEAFSPGKIFMAHNGVLFFDELNRAPERLQNALLQALEESEVTIGSYRKDVAADFIFIGTMNVQDSSTEKLSMGFLDRFDIITMNYPETRELEDAIVVQKGKHLAEVPPELLAKATTLVRVLRSHPQIEKAPSVRASIGLYERAQANALLRGRKRAEWEDIRDAIMSVLAHRIELKPSARYALSPEAFLTEELKKAEDDESTPIAGGDG